jgi:hypothetical protein
MIGLSHYVNLHNNFYYDGTAYFALDLNKESAPFHIKHLNSGKFIHPQGGSSNPSSYTKAIINHGTMDYTQFTFVPLSDRPGFGIIKHYLSGKTLHPEGGSPNAGDNTNIIFHEGYHEGTVWSIMTSAQVIMHTSGRYWHPRGGSDNPDDNTDAIIHHGNSTLAVKWVPVSASDLSLLVHCTSS